MPRTSLEVPVSLERLSVLGEDHSVDDELVPDLDDDVLRRLHRTMLLSRRFDERLLTLQRQGRIGTFAPAIGQEAAQVGSVSALRDDDWVVPSYRDSAAALWRGTPLWGLVLYDAGYNEGAEVPEGQKDLPLAVPVASQIPHAVGIGYAARYRDADEVVLTYFGDGATSEGDFHESLNFAAVQRCPVIFCCQNNQYAISTPIELQMVSQTIAQKAVAYGVPGIRVDGNDVLAMHVATAEAAKRARDGDGPTLIEAQTYRLSVHTTADDPSKYRQEDEVEQWRARDPIERLQRWLIDRDLLTDGDVEELESQIDDEIDEAVEEAERRMSELGDPLVMFDHIYAQRPAHLDEQREALAGTLKNGAGDG